MKINFNNVLFESMISRIEEYPDHLFRFRINRDNIYSENRTTNEGNFFIDTKEFRDGFLRYAVKRVLSMQSNLRK